MYDLDGLYENPFLLSDCEDVAAFAASTIAGELPVAEVDRALQFVRNPVVA